MKLNTGCQKNILHNNDLEILLRDYVKQQMRTNLRCRLLTYFESHRAPKTKQQILNLYMLSLRYYWQKHIRRILLRMIDALTCFLCLGCAWGKIPSIEITVVAWKIAAGNFHPHSVSG